MAISVYNLIVRHIQLLLDLFPRDFKEESSLDLEA